MNCPLAQRGAPCRNPQMWCGHTEVDLAQQRKCAQTKCCVWVYPEVRHHFGDSPGLHHTISAHVHALNAGIHTLAAGFTEPLPTNEARAIANSIHRWITTRSPMWRDGPVVYEATLSTIQSHRGRKSGQARLSAETKQTMREMRL